MDLGFKLRFDQIEYLVVKIGLFEGEDVVLSTDELCRLSIMALFKLWFVFVGEVFECAVYK